MEEFRVESGYSRTRVVARAVRGVFDRSRLIQEMGYRWGSLSIESG